MGDDELERGLEDGSYAIDTRLRDTLRTLPVEEGTETSRFAPPAPEGPALSFARPDVSDRALFAAETSIIPESDLALALGARIDDLEVRAARMERRSLSRVKSALSRGRGS